MHSNCPNTKLEVNTHEQSDSNTLTAVSGPGGGGTDIKGGYGDVRPWRPHFHACPVVCKGPISSKRVDSHDPLLRKFRKFNLSSLNFCPNFSSQASKIGKFSALKPPNLEIFSSQAPKFGNFQFTNPLFQRQISVRKPHTSEIQASHPYLKKKWSAPPPPGFQDMKVFILKVGLGLPVFSANRKSSLKIIEQKLTLNKQLTFL